MMDDNQKRIEKLKALPEFRDAAQQAILQGILTAMQDIAGELAELNKTISGARETFASVVSPETERTFAHIRTKKSEL